MCVCVGQVQSLTFQQRIELCRLIIFLDIDNELMKPLEKDKHHIIKYTELPVDDLHRQAIEANKQRIVKQTIRNGYTTVNMNPYVIEKQAQIGFNRDDTILCEGQNLQHFFEYLGKLDPTATHNPAYFMPGRVTILLRGLGSWLGVPHYTASHWRGIAEKFLKDSNQPLIPND